MNEKERKKKIESAKIEFAKDIERGGDYPTGIPCDPPEIKGDECSDGYYPECVNNEIVCKKRD